MMSYTDSILVDGGYTYLDPETAELRTVYPSNVHPFVIQFGEDYFVCGELVTDSGDMVTADFLVRNIDDEFRVVQMIIDNRTIIQSGMNKLGK